MKTFIAILSGLIIYAVIGKAGLYLLSKCWTAYAAASIHKSYTLHMLLCRLAVGLVASLVAGICAEKMENDKGKAAWVAGAIILCVAGYIHFVKVWTDYPLWYHLSYLLPVIPVMILSSGLVRRKD